jgi:hypothetical protein
LFARVVALHLLTLGWILSGECNWLVEWENQNLFSIESA